MEGYAGFQLGSSELFAGGVFEFQGANRVVDGIIQNILFEIGDVGN